MPGPTDNIGAILSSLQSPTAQQPSRALGLLPDVQFAPILSPKAFNLDNPIVRLGGGKPPTGLNKILAEMGFSAAAFNQSLSQISQAGAVQQASPADVFGHGLDTGGFAARIESPQIGPSIHNAGGGGRDF